MAKTKTSKKGTKKASRRKANTMIVPRTSIIPDRTLVKLPYVDIQNINIALGGGGTANNYGQKTYSINSIYDPEPNAANTTALGWTEYIGFYNKFRVYAVDYELTMYNASDDTMVSGALYFAPLGSSYNPTPGDPSSWLVQPRSRKFFLGNRSGGKSTRTIKGRISIPSLLGMTNEQYRTSEDTASVMLGAPLKNVSMYINTLNSNPGVNASQVQLSAKITYHCELFDRNVPNAPFNSIEQTPGVGSA